MRFWGLEKGGLPNSVCGGDLGKSLELKGTVHQMNKREREGMNGIQDRGTGT